MGLFGKKNNKGNKEVEKNQSRKLMSSFDLMEYFVSICHAYIISYPYHLRKYT